MKFTYRELHLKSKKYKVYEAFDVPKQLRALSIPKDYSCILANADGFKLLHSLFLIIAGLKDENTIFIVYDHSEENETYQQWYPGGEFHKNLMMFNFERTQVSVKDFNRLVGMLKYTKFTQVELNTPKYDFDKLPYWELDNSLTVKHQGKWIVLSSNYIGFTYMAREASHYHDLEDDPEDNFSHSHLDVLTKMVDVLDMKYFYQEH